MMARRVFLGLLASAGAAVLAGCNPFGGRRTFRFRMTVEVNTPDGVKTGSSVIEFYANKEFALTSEEGSGFTSGISQGEAVVVDIPSGPVFALLTNSHDATGLDILGAFAPELWDQPYQAKLDKVSELGGPFASARAELPRKDWPLLVRFRDINDPASVVLVNPDYIGIRHVFLESTTDSVTRGIERRLRWLKQDRKLGIKPSSSTNGIPLGNFKGLFSTEFR